MRANSHRSDVIDLLCNLDPAIHGVIELYQRLDLELLGFAVRGELRLTPEILSEFLSFDLGVLNKALSFAEKLFSGKMDEQLSEAEETKLFEVVPTLYFVLKNAVAYKEDSILKVKVQDSAFQAGFYSDELHTRFNDIAQKFRIQVREHTVTNPISGALIVESNSLSQLPNCLGVGYKGAAFLYERDDQNYAIKVPLMMPLKPSEAKTLIAQQGIPGVADLYAIGPAEGIGFSYFVIEVCMDNRVCLVFPLQFLHVLTLNEFH